MKKLFVIILSVLMLSTLAGCSFSVGNSNKSEKYEDVFTDRVAKQEKNYKYSDLVYDFTLGEYGKMKIYVDTSEGHKFELQSENGGFNILDKDGNVVLYAACTELGNYQYLTSYLKNTKTVNGRTFIYSDNGDGSVDLFSYMADCGLDAGLIMETKGDESAFELVAFRGEALEGASSDVYAYKGDPADYEDFADTVDEYEDEEYSEADEELYEEDEILGETSSAQNIPETQTYLSDEIEEKIALLDTDYNKIKWGVRYNIFEDFPGFVISVTPYYESGTYYLLVGMTNLYDTDFDFAAKAYAYDSEDNYIGESYIYQDAIGSANTVLAVISCGDKVPDGRIHWEEGTIEESEYDEYIPWELDYSVSGKASDGMLAINYGLYASNKEKIEDGSILYSVLLDEDGYVLSVVEDYILDEIPEGETYSGEIHAYANEGVLKEVANIAFFGNTTSSK